MNAFRLRAILLLAMLVGHALPVLSCDGCSLFFSLTPYDKNSTVSLIMRHRMQAGLSYPVNLHAHHRIMHGAADPVAGAASGPVPVRQTFTSATLNLRLALPAKCLLQMQMPWKVNAYHEPGLDKLEHGQGDLTLLAGWQGIEKRWKRNGFRITPMAGVKFPTGWQYASLSRSMAFMDLQGGTGSWDVIIAPNLVLRLGDWGLAGDVSYRINGTNPLGMRMANTWNGNTAVFKVISLRCGWEVLPSANMYWESMPGMYHSGAYMDATSSHLLSAGLGAQMVKDSWSLRATAFVPALQVLDTPQPREKWLCQLELTRSFQTNWGKEGR